MKKHIIILLIAVLTLSCTDLDVVPKDKLNPTVAFSTVDGYRQYLAKLYAALILTGQDGPANETTRDLQIIPDEGFTSYLRAYWQAQQLPTDETVISWNDSGIQDLNTHTWNSGNQFLRVMYYRIFFLVALTNDFLAQSEPSKVSSNGLSEEDQETVAQYRAEARFLRSLAYYHALDLFGNVPLITSTSTELPKQSTKAQIYEFIDEELKEIESGMIDAGQNQLGRADKAALWMLQSKLHMNAKQYAGAEAFEEALVDINKVIGSNAYELSENYADLFLADNHTSPEAIFIIRQDGVNSTNWGGTTFLVRSAILSSMSPADFGVGSGWSGTRATRNFVEKFTDLSGNTDARAMPIHFTGQTLEINDLEDETQGYGVGKFKNVDSNGDAGQSSDFPDTDFIMFRLADAYLTYAELAARGVAGADRVTAVQYVNQLRERAYGDNSGNIADADLTELFILDERSRELYWEAHRRPDLIRYERFAQDTYLWPWKGGVKDGEGFDVRRNIFPIPASDLSVNGNLNQNPGYL